MSYKIPKIQTAVQLIGPDELILNTTKPIPPIGPYQILARVEVVGLCFSDIKLLKQFSTHTRKSEVISGIDPEVLKQIPSYVPGDCPTVPGHEVVVRICEVGKKVKDVKSGARYLVQADYRWLLTASSNAAFGYDFEGALQEYVLMDQRVITSPDGESMLIPASDKLSASAVALVEPWACVENAYVSRERQCLDKNGQMLVVADVDISEKQLCNFLKRYGKPKQVTCVSNSPVMQIADIKVVNVPDVSALHDCIFDDIVYFGSNAETVEFLFGKLAARGLLNIVTCGGRFGRDIVIPVGRVHYGKIRVVGTTGSNPADSMEYIPQSGEIRKGDKINIIGAAGPMGVMHVVRNISQGIDGITILAGDLDEGRLALLNKIASPLAEKNNVRFNAYNPVKSKLAGSFDYTVLMVPAPRLVAESVKTAADKGIINIFAGIPATVTVPVDMDAYIKKRLYFVGTSGSTLEDMKVVLAKVETGKLDTNISVAAVCGLAQAIEGIRAIENSRVLGKIIVYPACKDLPLTNLDKMQDFLPKVAECLDNGFWNLKAEKSLLELKVTDRALFMQQKG